MQASSNHTASLGSDRFITGRIDECDSYEMIQTGLPKGRWGTLVYINARVEDITDLPTHCVGTYEHSPELESDLRSLGSLYKHNILRIEIISVE